MNVEPTDLIWMNGDFVAWEDAKVHVLTHGLHYGTGVFEGVRCYDTEIGPAVFRNAEHVERLLKSAELYYMPVPYSAEQIRAATLELVARNGLRSCYIRPIIYRGYGQMGLNPLEAPVDVTIACWEWASYLGEEGKANGIRAKVSSWRRIGSDSLIPHAKASGQYLNSVLAKIESLKAGYAEAILLDDHGYVCEGTGENIYLLRDGKIITPGQSNSILDGISRRSLIQIAQDLGYTVVERDIARAELTWPRRSSCPGPPPSWCRSSRSTTTPSPAGQPGETTRILQAAFDDAILGRSERYGEWLDVVQAAPLETPSGDGAAPAAAQTTAVALSRLLMDRTDGPLTAEQERQVTYIRRSAESLTELVNDLLDLAKVEAGKLEIRPRRFTVSELFGALRGVMKPLQQNDAVELIFEEPLNCPPLFTDEAKVAQILRNLISNALKFTERGEVRVAAAFDRETGLCSLEVTDTGIGIAPEDHDLVFQEFSQVASLLQFRAKGTGLGLPLSRRLAELLGGALTLRSTPGAGSAFTLCIPVSLGQMPSPAPADVSQPGQPRSVLLIDDEETSRYVLRQMLGGLGPLQVHEAETGAEGLRLAQSWRPDAVLLDLRLPDVDGFDVMDRLRADPSTADIPVIVCTSSLLPAQQRVRLSHARAILSKAALTRDGMQRALADVWPADPRLGMREASG